MLYTAQEKMLYNSLLDYNYSNPYITLDDIQKEALPSEWFNKQYSLKPTLDNLEALGLLLTGTEDTTSGDKRTYTPLVGKGKGSAYGYPCDEFKLKDWNAYKI